MGELDWILGWGEVWSIYDVDNILDHPKQTSLFGHTKKAFTRISLSSKYFVRRHAKKADNVALLQPAASLTLHSTKEISHSMVTMVLNTLLRLGRRSTAIIVKKKKNI